MAMTATIALSPSTAKTEQKVTATLTISNSAGYPVNVVTAQGYALPTGAGASNYNTAVAISQIVTGPGSNLVVPAGGDLVKTFSLKFHAPSTGVEGDVVQTYSVSANIISDDGSNFAPTAATVTVNYVVDL